MARHLTKELGFSGVEAKEFVQHFFAEIADRLAQGEPVQLTGLGTFAAVTRKARSGRNPVTGKYHPVPPRNEVKFKPSVHLRRMLKSTFAEVASADTDPSADS